MAKINKRIEIARSTDGKLNAMGNQTCDLIFAALSERYEHVSISVVNNIYDLEMLVDRKPDLVFLRFKRLSHADGLNEAAAELWPTEYLDSQGVNYIGSTADAMKLDFNKEKAKACVRTAGLPTAKSFTAIPGQYLPGQSLPLPYPLFIKPLHGGSSWGVDENSVVHSEAEFAAKVASIYEVRGSISLIEQYLEGREFSVAIIDGQRTGSPILMPIEIITNRNYRGDRILSSRVKHEDNEIVRVIPDTMTLQVVSVLAADVYQTLGGRDFGRIDIRMDSEGQPHFIEANFMPAPCSRYYAGAFLTNIGISHQEVLFEITQVALRRIESKRTEELRIRVNSFTDLIPAAITV